MTYPTLKIAAAAVLVLASIAPSTLRADISDVMKDAMKGETSLYRKVATGKGTPDDAKKLVDYLKQLPGETPPKGDAASWKEKTETLVKAAEDVQAGKPGALAHLQTVGNCKACHNPHK